MAKAQEIEMAQQEARLLRQLQQQGGVGGEGEEEEEECGETSLITPDEYTEDEDEGEVGNEVLDECPEYGNFDLRRQCHNNNRYSHHELQITL